MTLKDTHSTTFLQELVDGATRFASRDGQTLNEYGLGVLRVNLLAKRVAENALMTTETCGRDFSISLKSANLQSSLVSKLVKQLGMDGSIAHSDRDWETKTRL